MKKVNSTHASSRKKTAEIIQAALECFTELGYNETSMADICIRAKASTGSIYHHFKSKEQLASAVFLEGIEQYQAGMLGMLAGKNDARSGTVSVIEYHIDWICKNPDWSLFLFQRKLFPSVSGTDEKLLELNKNFVSGIMAWFGRHMDEGKIRRLSWEILFALLLGPCLEYTRSYLSTKRPAKINEAAAELSQAAWRSLSAE